MPNLHSALFLLTDAESGALKPAAHWPEDSKTPLNLIATARAATQQKTVVINSGVTIASDAQG